MLYTGGAAAIVPVVPLVGLRLGMSVPQVALLGTLAGVLAVIGPIPTGRLVHRIGERAALMVGATVAIASIIGCLIASTPTTGTWRLWLFAAAILVMSVGDLTWDLGRQTYLADEVPAHLRARAMTLFGGMMRIGRIIRSPDRRRGHRAVRSAGRVRRAPGRRHDRTRARHPVRDTSPGAGH
jgi:MFS family permease